MWNLLPDSSLKAELLVDLLVPTHNAGTEKER